MPLKLTQDLRARLAGAEKHLADLGKARHALVLPAATGDARARKALDDNAGEISRAERDVRDLKAAILQADEQYREERLSDAKRTAEQKLVEAKKLAVEFLEIDTKIDHALAMIGSAIKRRKELAGALVATGCMREAYLNRLWQPGSMLRAIHFHGVAEFIKTPMLNSQRETLHAQDERILSTLGLPALQLPGTAPAAIDPAPGAPDDDDEQEDAEDAA
jgi:hypothetical protein